MTTSTTSPSSFVEQVKDLAQAEQDLNSSIQSCQQNQWSKDVQHILDDCSSYQLTHTERTRDALTLLNQSSWKDNPAIVQHQISSGCYYITNSSSRNINEHRLLDSFQHLMGKLIDHYHKICHCGNEAGYIVVAEILDKNRRDKELLQDNISRIQKRIMAVRGSGTSKYAQHVNSS